MDAGSVLVGLIIFLLTWLWLRSRRPTDFPPGPRILPVIGNLRTLMEGDMLKVAKDLWQTYGDIVSLSIGPHWVIYVNGYDALKEVFVKHGEVFSDRPRWYYAKHIKKLKGIAYAYPWKKQRHFTLNLLKGFGFGNRSIEASIRQEADNFVKELQSGKGKPVCISGTVNKAVSNVINSIVFGRHFEYDDEEFSRFIHAITQTVVNKYIPKVNFLPFLLWLPKVRKSCEECVIENTNIREWIQRQIDEHKTTLDENDPRDFIDAFLVEIKKINDPSNTQFTVENLKYIILDLFSAGTETTSTTIQWAMLYLVRYPKIQEKLRTEILKNATSGPPSLSARPNMPYCQAFIAETLRLGNILPMSVPHFASEETHVYGHRIPKDAIVIPNLASMCTDEKVFPEHNKFDPERFLNEDGSFRYIEKFVPFSLGKRVCLGEVLARNELFLFFTSIVHKFKILPEEGEELPPIVGRLGITHGPVPYKVRFVEYETP